MRSKLFLNLALVGGLAGGLFGLAATPALAEEDLAKAFAAADQNGDGYVDVDEYVAAVVLRFQELDVNGDRYLVMSETPSGIDRIFKLSDRNGDGKLSVGETVGDRMVRFFDIDTDKDGLLTLTEVTVYVQEMGE